MRVVSDYEVNKQLSYFLPRKVTIQTSNGKLNITLNLNLLFSELDFIQVKVTMKNNYRVSVIMDAPGTFDCLSLEKNLMVAFTTRNLIYSI